MCLLWCHWLQNDCLLTTKPALTFVFGVWYLSVIIHVHGPHVKKYNRSIILSFIQNRIPNHTLRQHVDINNIKRQVQSIVNDSCTNTTSDLRFHWIWMWQQKFEVRNCTGFYEALTLLWDTIDKLCDTPTSKKDCCLATSSITNVFGLRTRIFLRRPLTVENPGLGVTLDLRYWYWHCLHTTFLQMWNIWLRKCEDERIQSMCIVTSFLCLAGM